MRQLRLLCLLAAALATTACGIKGPVAYPDGTPAPNHIGNHPGAPAK